MKTLLAVLCLALASSVAHASESIDSTHLGQARTFTVHVPESYESQSALYPVLYVLDGESSFDYSVAVAEYLADNGLVPDMIVVAIDAGATRATDFVPSGDPSKGAEAYLGFLTEELVPYIEAHYRAAPLRVLAGHSLGGLFVTHALMARPEAFHGYLAMSPYLAGANVEPLLTGMGATLRDPSTKGFFYAVLGAEPEIEPAFARLESLLTNDAHAPFTWRIERDAGKTHMTTRMVGLYNGLEECFAGWALSQQDLAEGGYTRFAVHIDSLSLHYGYPVLLGEQSYRAAAQQFMAKGDAASANQVAAAYAGQYADSPFAHFLVAVTFAQLGQREKALASLTRAIELDDSDPAPELAPLRPHMKELRAALSGH